MDTFWHLDHIIPKAYWGFPLFGINPKTYPIIESRGKCGTLFFELALHLVAKSNCIPIFKC